MITQKVVDGVLGGSDVCRIGKCFIQPVYRNAHPLTDDEVSVARRFSGFGFVDRFWRFRSAARLFACVCLLLTLAMQRKVEVAYLDRMSDFFEEYGSFYFAYEYDLLTRTQAHDPTRAALPLWRRCDRRFFWNYFATQPFRERNLHRWILPVMDACESRRPIFWLVFLRFVSFRHLSLWRQSFARKRLRSPIKTMTSR